MPHQDAAWHWAWQLLTAAQREQFMEMFRAAPAAKPQPPPIPGAGPLPAEVNLALPLIREFEDCRLTAYPDPGTGGEPWTIGWGSTTYEDGEPVRRGQTVSAAQAERMLTWRVALDCRTLAGKVPGWAGLSTGQRAALLSFSYNVGSGWYGTEGFATLSKALREGRLADVPAALRLYVNPGSKVEAGLKRRREAAIGLWLAGATAAPGPAPGAGDRRQWVTAIKALNLSQPDASTCQAACIGMAVGDRDVVGIRRKLQAIGTAGDPAVMARVIRSYGRPYRYEGNACLDDVLSWLKAGEFLITHGWFTASGHVICLDGLRSIPGGRFEFDVKDPWSEFNAPAWRYDKTTKFYDGFYSEPCVYAACVAGVSASDAARVYQVGRVDRTRRGMWVHRFTTA
jgi:GH24 family phage-related lysozyme (muramidase)